MDVPPPTLSASALRLPAHTISKSSLTRHLAPQNTQTTHAKLVYTLVLSAISRNQTTTGRHASTSEQQAPEGREKIYHFLPLVGQAVTKRVTPITHIVHILNGNTAPRSSVHKTTIDFAEIRNFLQIRDPDAFAPNRTVQSTATQKSSHPQTTSHRSSDRGPKPHGKLE